MTRPQLRTVSARTFVRALKHDGFFLSRVTGSHHVFRRSDGRRVVVPFHAPGDTFAPGTLRTMLRLAGWEASDLVRLGLVEERGRSSRAA